MSTPPILFVIFNRPDTTQVTFEQIRKAKPKSLYVAADGPRPTKSGEAELCRQTRDIIAGVDWDCEVHTRFLDENLGCKKAVSSAISWFFEHVESGIILEDDCVPDPSFFAYCDTLLDYYRDDPRIMMISGDNFQKGIKRGDGSYYFSHFCPIWGWACWSRAWEKYDIEMTSYPAFIENGYLENLFPDQEERDFWKKNFDSVHQLGLNTWDYQWTYCVMSLGGMTITPNVNLVKNIGFGEGGTHTTQDDHPMANMPTYELTEIVHPSFCLVNRAADEYTFSTYLKKRYSLGRRFEKYLKRKLLSRG